PARQGHRHPGCLRQGSPRSRPQEHNGSRRGSPLRRLHQLSDRELEEWQEARKAVGWEKYGESSYRRYNLVDVMEELMDAEVILERFQERLMLEQAGESGDTVWATLLPVDKRTLEEIRLRIREAKFLLQQLDRVIPDHACTDEAGGERIWWNERHLKKEDTR